VTSRLFATMAGALVVAIACGPRGGDTRGGGTSAGDARASADRVPPRPPTAQERLGRAIYERENCARCHALLDRPGDEQPARLPVPAAPAAIPSRVGPDLGIEGHRRSDDWQYAHLYAPDVLVPGSPMPASRHLFRVTEAGMPEPTGEALALVAWLQSLGRERRDVWAELRAREPSIPAPDAVPDAQRLETGARLYAQYCVACHGEAGDGLGPAAALLARPPRNFVTASYRFRSNGPWDRPRDADLFRAITLGSGTGAAMPSFQFLSAAERWALVARIKEFSPALRGSALTWGPPELPGAADTSRSGITGPDASAHTAPTLESGRVLWDSLGCARCHGVDAAGRSAAQAGMEWIDAEGKPITASGDLRHACGRRGGGSDVAFDRAIRFGVGAAMPSFGAALVAEPDAARALRLYVESLDDGASPAAGR
jgi:mono/diheme cytochrome c family protein